jgi:hypothetical protein
MAPFLAASFIRMLAANGRQPLATFLASFRLWPTVFLADEALAKQASRNCHGTRRTSILPICQAQGEATTQMQTGHS